jgi:hypothetical protein
MKLDARKLELNPSTNNLVYGLMGVGVLTFVMGLFLNASRTWHAFLLNHSLFMGLAIGGLFFIVIHYLAFAGWNVAMRRVSESFVSYLVYAFAFNIILFFGISTLYPWTDQELMATDHLLHGKQGYFTLPFYIGRVLVFFGVTVFFAWKLLQNSTAQDEEGGVSLLERQKPLSALFLVFFAPLFTIFSVDLLKSLEPKWFSTIFGVYVFIGFAQASVAASILVIRMLQRHGYLNVVTNDHFHDLGKYLFGFGVFWAYIGVSQYLLIWYANIPEETTFYIFRQIPGWSWVSLVLPVLRFVLPFLLLLPRMAKRTPAYLEKICWLVLVGAWLDLYWMVMPNFSPERATFSLWDVGLFLGFLGFFAFAVRRFLSRHATVPQKDPFLHETMHHHVM